MQAYDLIVIGGGIAGMSSAVAAKKNGVEKILILEKESELGGKLNQRTDSGFGIEIFGENLTATEFSQKFIDEIEALHIEYKLDTTVLEITKEKTVKVVNPKDGVFKIKGKALIFATGCMEFSGKSIKISGSKFAGIYSAGVAQQITNVKGLLPGKSVVIVGTGNIGLIMARTLILEGAKVKCIIESQSNARGNKKYLRECREDFNIPIFFNHIITGMQGTDRIENIMISETDSSGRKIEGTEESINCDTLILSVELIPNDSLLKKSGILSGGKVAADVKGVYVCGDANYVHDGTTSIVIESSETGARAARYILEQKFK